MIRWRLALLILLFVAAPVQAWSAEKPQPRLWLPLVIGVRPAPCICLPEGP